MGRSTSPGPDPVEVQQLPGCLAFFLQDQQVVDAAAGPSDFQVHPGGWRDRPGIAGQAIYLLKQELAVARDGLAAAVVGSRLAPLNPVSIANDR